MPTFNGSSAASSSFEYQFVTIYGYTNERLIEALYGQLGLSLVFDDAGTVGTVSTPAGNLTEYELMLRHFIREAEQTVFIRLQRFFEATEMVGNAWIETRTTWIAAFLISQRRGQEHYFADKYAEAIRELDAIATGELEPPVDIARRSYDTPSMSNLTVDERFSSRKLRVKVDVSVGQTRNSQDISYGWLWGWF